MALEAAVRSLLTLGKLPSFETEGAVFSTAPFHSFLRTAASYGQIFLTFESGIYFFYENLKNRGCASKARYPVLCFRPFQTTISEHVSKFMFTINRKLHRLRLVLYPLFAAPYLLQNNLFILFMCKFSTIFITLTEWVLSPGQYIIRMDLMQRALNFPRTIYYFN